MASSRSEAQAVLQEKIRERIEIEDRCKAIAARLMELDQKRQAFLVCGEIPDSTELRALRVQKIEAKADLEDAHELLARARHQVSAAEVGMREVEEGERRATAAAMGARLLEASKAADDAAKALQVALEARRSIAREIRGLGLGQMSNVLNRFEAKAATTDLLCQVGFWDLAHIERVRGVAQGRSFVENDRAILAAFLPIETTGTADEPVATPPAMPTTVVSFPDIPPFKFEPKGRILANHHGLGRWYLVGTEGKEAGKVALGPVNKAQAQSIAETFNRRFEAPPKAADVA